MPVSFGGPANPYVLVLSDLRAKRDELDRTIKTLESQAGLAPAEDAPAGAEEYAGMPIHEAAKALLAREKRTMGNAEIAAAIQAGGLAMGSADPVNTVGAVLTRRFQNAGDIVKVGRGTWGLPEWYPGQTFTPASVPSRLKDVMIDMANYVAVAAP